MRPRRLGWFLGCFLGAFFFSLTLASSLDLDLDWEPIPGAPAPRPAKDPIRERVEDLLRRAEANLQAGQLTKPDEDNAWQKYVEASRLDPGNARAAAGLKEIVGRYVKLAEDRLKRKDWAKAEEYLDRAGQVLEGDQRVRALRKRLKEDRELSREIAEEFRRRTEPLREMDEARKRAEAQVERARREAQARLERERLEANLSLELARAGASAQRWQAERQERERMRKLLAAGVISRQEAERVLGRPQAPPPEWTNSVGMRFRWIPAGSSMMGGEGHGTAEPRHKVTISQAFFLGIYEVTQAQWEAVMGGNTSNFKGPDLPVEQISWNDAQEFIQLLNQKEGADKYRLPTEAEWEYACRAGTETQYSFGEYEGRLGEYGWYDGNAGKRTHPVGEKKPNPWGLYDMHGNVWEWCQDWFGPYPAKAQVDPRGPPSGSARVRRGGSWFSYARGCRSAERASHAPGSSFDLGFRLLRTP